MAFTLSCATLRMIKVNLSIDFQKYTTRIVKIPPRKIKHFVRGDYIMSFVLATSGQEDDKQRLVPYREK